MDESPAVLARRLRTALELMELGLAMKLQSLRRDHPGEDDAALRRRLNTWLRGPPPAEPCFRVRRFGDDVTDAA